MFTEGELLDNTYRVVRLIGEGGMGVVYEATHTRLAGRYAIKVLLQKLSDSPDALARFNREAKITSSLQHPNIVQVIDFNTHSDGTEYLVMEYLQGETLAERLARQGALPTATVVGIVEQVAAGLAAAHSHRIVHRDLKPDNVFLVPIEGREIELAKVLDFGISKIKDINRGLRGPESALMGTPQYMSPEQCQGRTGDVDAATDQFALAVITYEMLTGRPPFVGDSVGTVLSQVLYADPPPMGIDPEIEAVVRKGLAKAKQERFPAVTAFAAALRDAVASQRSGVVVAAASSGRPNTVTGSRGELGHSAYDKTVRENTLGQSPDSEEIGQHSLRRRRRSWGGVLTAVGVVSLTVFVVVAAAKKLEGSRREAMLPAPVLRKERLVDVTLQPPKLPALTATVPRGATAAETGGKPVKPRLDPAPVGAGSLELVPSSGAAASASSSGLSAAPAIQAPELVAPSALNGASPNSGLVNTRELTEPPPLQADTDTSALGARETATDSSRQDRTPSRAPAPGSSDSRSTVRVDGRSDRSAAVRQPPPPPRRPAERPMPPQPVRPAAPYVAPAPAAPASRPPTRAPTALDEDAILPLDESVGETR